MPRTLMVERAGADLRLTAAPGGSGLMLHSGGADAPLTPDDLHWLITAGGPALLALLGGPLEGRGIETRTPPAGGAGGASSKVSAPEAGERQQALGDA